MLKIPVPFIKIRMLGKKKTEWFIDNKLSIDIHFGDDKQKIISNEKPTKTKHLIQRLLSKTIQYCRIFGCYLDSSLNGEWIVHIVLKKINTKLNFLWRQSNYFNYSSRRLEDCYVMLLYNNILTMDAHHSILSKVGP